VCVFCLLVSLNLNSTGTKTEWGLGQVKVCSIGH
jgi:hypothetical protein